MNKMIIVALALMAPSAFAKWQPIKDTTTLTCQQAKSAVTRNGFQHYTVNGKPKLPRYNTYWASQNDCSERAVTAFVPTLDKRACFIGYTCASRDRH